MIYIYSNIYFVINFFFKIKKKNRDEKKKKKKKKFKIGNE